MTQADNNQLTIDSFYYGKVTVYQNKEGYRFSIDSPMLADFLPSRINHALEVGTGSGIISLLALYKNKISAVTGIEIQLSLYKLACLNATCNSLQDRFHLVLGDFLYPQLIQEKFELIYFNPPFLKSSSGRLSTKEEIAVAKFEKKISLDAFLKRSSVLLQTNGSICMIFPYERLDELKQAAHSTGLFISKLRFIHSFSHGKASRFLVQLTNTQAAAENMEALIIFKEQGIYTDEMEKIVSGNE
jgi:tRNA1Val (adenine37-N6)-methyltransferase